MRYYKLLPVVSVTLLLCSCSPRLYFPDRANVPALKEAHEVKADVSAKLQNPDGGGNAFAPSADVAYAVTSHIGIMASWRSLVNRIGYLYPTYDKPSNYSSNNTSVSLSGNRFEGGAGYFTRLGHQGIFEAYGGYGNGTLTGDEFFHTSYHRLFVQSEAGYSNDVVSVMYGIRVAAQRYYNFRSADSTLRYEINADHNYSYPQQQVDFTRETFWFVEPFINVEVGYKYVFFNTQIGFSGQVDHNSSISGDSYLYLSMGVVFHFAPHLLKQL